MHGRPVASNGHEAETTTLVRCSALRAASRARRARPVNSSRQLLNCRAAITPRRLAQTQTHSLGLVHLGDLEELLVHVLERVDACLEGLVLGGQPAISGVLACLRRPVGMRRRCARCSHGNRYLTYSVMPSGPMLPRRSLLSARSRTLAMPEFRRMRGWLRRAVAQHRPETPTESSAPCCGSSWRRTRRPRPGGRR